MTPNDLVDAWYGASDLAAWNAAVRATREWPVISSGVVARAHGTGNSPLRAGADSPEASAGFLLEVPERVFHPAVLAALSEAMGVPVERLRRVARGEAAVVDGVVVEEPEPGSGEEGHDVVEELVRRHLVSAEMTEDLLYPRRWPVPPASSRKPRTKLGEHPIDTHLGHAARHAAVLSAWRRAGAPSMITDETHRLLQASFDAIVERVRGGDPASTPWVASDARHVASFLRSDEGEDLGEDELWRWFYGPRTPHGPNEVRWYREKPWARKTSFVLGLVVADDAVVVVLRHGLLIHTASGWSQLLRVGPLRPFVTDGRFVGFLPAHPRGGHAPDVFILDTAAATFIDRWPPRFPDRFVYGHWGAKSLVIWDRKARLERLLRSSLSDDFGHHFHSPDGSLVWLDETPEDGVVSIDDGWLVADLARIGLAKKRGTFPRAFALVDGEVFRTYVAGRLRQDADVAWTDDRPADAAAFSTAGDRLVTARGATLQLRTLSPSGEVITASTLALPLERADFRAPPSPSTALADIAFTSFGPLHELADVPASEASALILQTAHDWHLPDDQDVTVAPADFDAEVARWVDEVWATARRRRDQRARRTGRRAPASGRA